jgi:hypothetical protein
MGFKLAHSRYASGMRSIVLFLGWLLVHRACTAKEVQIPSGYDNRPVRIPITFAKGEVQVQVGSIPYDFPRVPSQALSAALKADRKSNLFRLSWRVERARNNFRSTVLYNRRRRTLKYFHSDLRWSRKSSVQLKRVSDSTIHKLATSHEGETRQSGPLGPLDTETAGFTQYITRYGARITQAGTRSPT